MGVRLCGVNDLKSIKATSHIERHLSGSDYLRWAHLTAYHDQEYEIMADLETLSQFQIGQFLES